MNSSLKFVQSKETNIDFIKQLESIYAFCSEKFHKTINSPDTLFDSIKSLCNENKSKSSGLKSDNNLLVDTVSMFEELLKTQLEEIQSLSKQRDDFLKIIEMYGQMTDEFDQNFKKMRAIIESQNSKSIFDDEFFNEISTDIVEIGINENKISKSHDIRNYIIETVTNLFNDFKTKNDLSKELEIKAEKSESFISAKKYQLILNQLEGSMKFIQNIANSNQDFNSSILRGPLISDEVTRSLLLSQCARIGQFIDKNDLQYAFNITNERKNIFDIKLIQNPKEFLQPLLNSLTDEQIPESSTRELYILLVGTMEINKFILDRMENLEKSRNQDEYKNEIPFSNEELLAWKNEYDSKMQMIAEQIGATDIPPEELLDHFLDVYLDTVEENKDLQNTIIENQQGFKDNEKQNFEKLKMQLGEIEQTADNEKEKRQNQINQLNQQISQLKSEKQQLIDSNAQLVSFLKTNETKLKTANDELNQLKELTNQKAQSVSDNNSKLNKDIETLTNLLRKQNEGMAKASNKIQKLSNQKDILKQKLAEAEAKNKSIESDFNLQKEQENEQYISEINKLESDLNDLQKEVKNLEAEKEKAIAQKDDLTNQLIKTRVSEKSLKIKLDALENRVALNKKESEYAKTAFINSINAEATMKVEKIRSDYEKFRLDLTKLIKYKYKAKFASYNQFNDEIPSDDQILQKVDELIGASSELQDQSDDINELRSILGIPENQTLANGAKSISDTILNLTKQNSEYRARNDIVLKRSADLEMKRNEQENAIKIAFEWEQWSKSILFRITNGTAIVHGVADIRFLLEEALLSTIGHRSLLMKLDILQAEKKLFLTFSESECLFNEDETSDNVESLQTLMVVVMFIRRLQVISHCLPAKFI